MNFDLIAHTSDDRRLMTLRAGISIEQWAEAIFRFEDPLENSLPRLKLCLLIGGEISQRFSKCWLLRCLASPKKESQQQRANDSFRIHRLFSFQMSGIGFRDRL